MTYRRGPHDELNQAVDVFEAALRDLAWDLAARVIADELSRRPAATRRTGRRLPIADEAAPPAPREPVEQPAQPAIAAVPAAVPDGKRIKWTRERVIAELCEWLISGIVEPAFMRRHGKPGLVTAATRIFGRFDSALNVANLYLAKQYPDGPPAKRNAVAHGRERGVRAPRIEAAAGPDAPEPASTAPNGANGANGANGTNGNGAAAEGAARGTSGPSMPAPVSEIAAAPHARSTSE